MKTEHSGGDIRFRRRLILMLLLIVLTAAFRCIKAPQPQAALTDFAVDPAAISVQTDHNAIDNEQVSPDTWRRINLEMRKADGSTAKIELLRPLWWLDQTGARDGGSIFLSMPEMGIEGDAKVLEIGPCKADNRSGESQNRIVTGKFTHENAIVIDLFFNNNPDKPLGVTPYHLLWSATRNGWIQAGQLKIGELVKTRGGTAQLTMHKLRKGRHRVYNLEIQKNHTYYVSNIGILAHNMCAERIKGTKKKHGPKKTPVKRSETQGSLTNLGSNPGAHNKTNFDLYPSGSGFSGAYDPKSGKFLAYPSGNTRLKDGGIPENLVDRMGGHKATNEALSGVLGEHTSNRLGFVMIKDKAGNFEVRWNSRQINSRNPNFTGRTVPKGNRQEILDAISEATGRKAYGVE